ncbi:hypothetical protein FGO68_gene1242 [Halteria grandinella]|uniref:Uncharacterized protein n=1 Tax=Halteria grandinella TaxID=5974 RepID=A0A8J8P5Q2_HALGN|nr:hypothetical protein FGO68_gene1242 [Halteria grandinella]
MSQTRSANSKLQEYSAQLGLRGRQAALLDIQQPSRTQAGTQSARLLSPTHTSQLATTVSPANRQLTSFMNTQQQRREDLPSDVKPRNILASAPQGGTRVMDKGAYKQGALSSHQNQERLQNLYKRLNQLNLGNTHSDENKAAKVEKLDLALSDMEQLIISQIQHSEETYAFFREESDELRGKLDKEQGLRETEDENMTKNMRTFESEAKFRITKCKNTRKDKESEILKQVDELAFQLTLELAKSKKAREETEDRCAEELGLMLDKLEGDMEQERKAKDNTVGRMFEELNGQVQKCMEDLNDERGAREDTENQLYQMIQDMENTLLSEIQDERMERERSEEGFMNLLEETCARIERNLMQ